MRLNCIIIVIVIVSCLSTCMPRPSPTKDTGRTLNGLQTLKRILIKRLGARIAVKTTSSMLPATAKQAVWKPSSSSSTSSPTTKSVQPPSERSSKSAVASLLRSKRCAVKYDHPCATSKSIIVQNGKEYITYTCMKGFPTCSSCGLNTCGERKLVKDGKVHVTECTCNK